MFRGELRVKGLRDLVNIETAFCYRCKLSSTIRNSVAIQCTSFCKYVESSSTSTLYTVPMFTTSTDVLAWLQTKLKMYMYWCHVSYEARLASTYYTPPMHFFAATHVIILRCVLLYPAGRLQVS